MHNVSTDYPLILALGDSLTAGYGLGPGESFAAQLEVLLRRGRPKALVHNGGVSGDTSVGGLARLPRLLDRMARRPDLCLVELGANDLLRGVDPAATEANLDAILTLLAARGVPALLCGMIAPAWLGGHAARFNAIWRALAARHGVALDPFFLVGVAGMPGLTLRDGLHPNARAVATVAARIAPLVERLLAREGVVAPA